MAKRALKRLGFTVSVQCSGTDAARIHARATGRGDKGPFDLTPFVKSEQATSEQFAFPPTPDEVREIIDEIKSHDRRSTLEHFATTSGHPRMPATICASAMSDPKFARRIYAFRRKWGITAEHNGGPRIIELRQHVNREREELEARWLRFTEQERATLKQVFLDEGMYPRVQPMYERDLERIARKSGIPKALKLWLEGVAFTGIDGSQMPQVQADTDYRDTWSLKLAVDQFGVPFLTYSAPLGTGITLEQHAELFRAAVQGTRGAENRAGKPSKLAGREKQIVALAAEYDARLFDHVHGARVPVPEWNKGFEDYVSKALGFKAGKGKYLFAQFVSGPASNREVLIRARGARRKE